MRFFSAGLLFCYAGRLVWACLFWLLVFCFCCISSSSSFISVLCLLLLGEFFCTASFGFCNSGLRTSCAKLPINICCFKKNKS